MYEVFNSLGKAQTVRDFTEWFKKLNADNYSCNNIQDIGFFSLQNLSENLTVSISDKN